MSRPSIDSILTTDSEYSNHPAHVLITDARFQADGLGGCCCRGNVQARRVLLALLDHAIDEEGKVKTAKAIRAAVDFEGSTAEKRQALVDLAQAWLDHLIYPILAAGRARRQAPSEAQTPTFQSTAALIDSASRGDQAALVDLLHRREGNRCLITRERSVHTAGDLIDEHLTTVQAAHVLPLSLNNFADNNNDRLRQAAITWDMLRTWGSLKIQKWTGSRINSADNAILVKSDIHYMFENFKWWFSSTDDPKVFFVRSNIALNYKNQRVTFRDHSLDPIRLQETGIPLPDPEILALHAAFARVLHASGAAEHFDKTWRDPRVLRVLAKDGSSDLGAVLSSLALPIFAT